MTTTNYRIPAVRLKMVREGTINAPLRTCANGAEAAAIARAFIGDEPNECLIAILVNSRTRATAVVTIARGGRQSLAVTVADVLRAVLVGQATAFILAHNHPSGDPTPSREDVVFTNAIAKASRVVGLPLLDHVIVADDGFACVPIPEVDE